MKQFFCTLLIFLLIGSLCLNLYHYGYRWAFERGLEAGRASFGREFVQQFKRDGVITVLIDGRSVVLVPKPSSSPSK